MTDLSLHYRLLADALPGEEKRIRSSYVPSLVARNPTQVIENMAERVGFEPVSKRQTKDLTEHGQQFKSL
jgi:hypothetical protein